MDLLFILCLILFRAFWARERVAQQWVIRPEGNRELTQKSGRPEDLLPIYNASKRGANSPGTHKKYDWSLVFKCRRFRKSPEQLIIKRNAVGQGCTASIRIRKPVLQDRVEVEYNWRHSHEDSPKVRAHLPLGNNELAWTKARVAEGQDWKGIKANLRLDKATLDMVLLHLPLDINFHCVYIFLFSHKQFFLSIWLWVD